MAELEPPKVTAVFKVIFDQKVGYTTAWKQSLDSISLDGVEYKSLPSGLHSVKQDLVYFVHGDQVGISAFAHAASDDTHRHASFVAVGILVSQGHGLAGQAWLHATELRRLARLLVDEGSDSRHLEVFWRRHAQSSVDGKAEPQPRGGNSEQGLTSDHPAIDMVALLDTFGPLIFPLYRASLLRKRILLMGSPPVQRNCNFVYALSVLSTTPTALDEVLPRDAERLFRTRPLYSVGIPDIPLMSQEAKSGWVATTTDDILGDKHALYDVVVNLSPLLNGSTRQWPSVSSSEGTVIKATQRDLRRYRILRQELFRLRYARAQGMNEDDENDNDESELIRNSSNAPPKADTDRNDPAATTESVSWNALAYNTYMKWGSSDEILAWEEEEVTTDRQLLAGSSETYDTVSHTSGLEEDEVSIVEAQAVATLLTAYFHRLTTLTMQTLADAQAEADDEGEAETDEDLIVIRADHLRTMGLDIWSTADMQFVAEATQLYFGRGTIAEDNGFSMCGLRVC